MYAAAISHCISSNSFSYRFQSNLYQLLAILSSKPILGSISRYWGWLSNLVIEPLRNFFADLMATRRPRLDMALFDLYIRY